MRIRVLIGFHFQATRFDGHYWNKNGPVILTDAVEGICQKIPPTSINSDRFENWRCGHGLKILPPELGCPISAKEYRLFYDPVKNDQVVDRIKVVGESKSCKSNFLKYFRRTGRLPVPLLQQDAHRD